MLARHHDVLNVTCKLMKDSQHSGHAGAVRLRAAVRRSAWSSLTIMRWSCTTKRRSCRWPLPPNPLGCAFRYLRRNENLFIGENWRRFVAMAGSGAEDYLLIA
ncbi:uncharacterized protein [Aegilops tauschii subsp. strangulata]|uniref:uncharacterized protein n=1 Tax=Aegilops tauschii subsp. strangulata TaxID=200361 RepID=UPI003CC8663C